MSLLRAAAVLVVTACGCASIAGFDELSRGCPPDATDCEDDGGTGASGSSGTAGSSGSAGAAAAGGTAATAGASGNVGASGSGETTGSSGSGGTGGASGSCDGPPPGVAGPAMAKIRRGDSCFWIDTTEVTEGQFAEYLKTNPAPSDDPLCSGPADVVDACKRATSSDGGGIDPLLPKTCVDWCGARDFCKWAKKELCEDDLRAIGEQQLIAASDFFAACTQVGENPTPFGDDCGSEICNVNGTGPLPAGGITSCFTLGADEQTKVYDLIGNVSEWTVWCFAQKQDTECAVRGSYFMSGRTHKCCEQLSQMNRRKTSNTVGFRCCAYP